tara:strand:- start:221 stop:397 length:177 start_codon:yes stop_codon:yes gene_type:complete
MSKKIPQQYEIGKEMPEEDRSVEVDLRRYKTKSQITGEIPRGLTKVQEEIWRLQNKKK